MSMSMSMSMSTLLKNLTDDANAKNSMRLNFYESTSSGRVSNRENLENVPGLIEFGF